MVTNGSEQAPAATAGTASAGPWTTRKLLAWMMEAFDRKSVDEPRRSAELLLEHVLGCRRMDLYTNADRQASPDELNRLRALTTRALAQEPVQYLLGEWSFFGLTIKLDRRVLIPRPCTEIIPTEVLQHARKRRDASPDGPQYAPLIADIGTGSGCIALAILAHLPEASAIASDLSNDALDVARANAERLNLGDRITFVEGDLLEPVARELDRRVRSLDYLVSNPPYIPDHEWDTPEMVGRNVKGHEPDTALRGGTDGLRFVRPIIEEGPELLRPGGLMLIEFASSTVDAVLALAARHPMLEGECIINDLDGLPRVLVAQRSNAPALPV
jgi:release factor glutamine methyltransferase